ncbi:hypothetical protein CS062_17445 [Roseateles chitinivorans]|uniref:Uncharacterized protein n=1 Tax=Roseateles chitinivorans TaxID=2917965 RepID=A0A2G9C636_9BURK|nr:hypothetical protein [Roseateles chitinivorans]PIM51910.1 hypothetical protein CS062_17445 [Roseateles chitinivorans]
MIPYFGLPITPAAVAAAAVQGGHAFVSFAHPEQLDLAIDVCQSLALDNGAFSAWVSGKPITDWNAYYEWVAALHRLPCFDFAVIPDVIDGDEDANDALIEQWPWRSHAPWIGAPVWHLHESLERLERLALSFPRICLGSSGQFARIGTPAWWNRMAEAFNVICDKHGRPICKVHGLRMLDPEVFTRFPLASVDSTNIGQNVGIDSKWRGTYMPPNKEWRARVMRARIEAHASPAYWDRQPTTQSLLEVA